MDIKELQIINDKKQNHPWEYARCKLIKDIIKNHIKVPIEGSILDIGSGDIFFLTEFSKKYSNAKLIAVDTAYSDKLITFLTEKHKDQKIFFFKSINEIKNIYKPISLIFLLDVIEHIENDTDFLKQLSTQTYVQTNTLFFITVPAYQSLFCNHDKWLGHYRRYSQKQLKKHIEQSGLSYITGGYFFTSLLLPRFLQKKIQNLKKDETINGIGDWKGGKLISAIYKFLLLSDYYFSKFLRLFRIRMPGLSTYAICKKSGNNFITKETVNQ